MPCQINHLASIDLTEYEKIEDNKISVFIVWDN